MALPPFYCTKTLLGFHPGPDLNRITLHGPEGLEITLLEMGEERSAKAAGRLNELAARLSEVWEISLINAPAPKIKR